MMIAMPQMMFIEARPALSLPSTVGLSVSSPGHDTFVRRMQRKPMWLVDVSIASALARRRAVAQAVAGRAEV